MSSKFSFPMLKSKHVHDTLHELGVTSVTMEQLEDPKRESVEAVFEQMVEMCMGLSREELTQPPVTGPTLECEHPELFAEGVPRTGFFKSCQELLDACGCPGFSMRDFTRPDPKRYRRFLSAMINFVKYRTERLMEFSDLNDQLDSAFRLLDMSAADVEEKTVALAETEAAREAERPAIDAATKQAAELEAEVKRMNTTQAHERYEIQELKSVSAGLKDELSSKYVTLEEERLKTERVREQLVQSPEREKQEVSRMAEQQKSEEAECVAVDRQRRDMKQRLERSNKLLKRIRKLQTEVELTKAKFREKKAEGKKVKALNERLANGRDDIAASKTEKKMLERAISRTTEKLTDFRAAADMKAASSKKALQATKAELETLTRENEALSGARDAAWQRKRAIEIQREEMRRKHKEAVAATKASMDELRSHLHTYHSSLRTAMRV